MARTKQKKKARTKTRRPRQHPLPGMENVTIKEIDEAAAEYVDARDNRMAMQKDEVEKSDRLLELMRKHGQTTYHYDSMVVKVLSKTKVSVKKDKEESNGDLSVTQE